MTARQTHATGPHIAALDRLIHSVDAEFECLGLSTVGLEEWDCLLDPARADEAIDMVDDWSARCGLSNHMRGELTAWIVDNYYVNNR